MGHFLSVINKRELQVLYSGASEKEMACVLSKLGPLEHSFIRSIETEHMPKAIADDKLQELFELCTNEKTSVNDLYEILYLLSPGNGHVGFRQVNLLVDLLRARVLRFLRDKDAFFLTPHDHAFGSGGDFKKTIHATTNACIIVAPLATICKTGTINITSHHGSSQAITKIGYSNQQFDPNRINYLLSEYGFAFVSLSSLGFPYTETLREARRRLWDESVSIVDKKFNNGLLNWQEVLKTTDIPIDIFKIVSPNAQVLNPVHHSTGVCHINMIPYVLSIYFHLGSKGVIMHSYDGIDEISNASTEKILPNNIIISVNTNNITIAEFAPEDIDLSRASIQDIQERATVEEEAETFWQIISGIDRGPKRDFIVANVAALLVASEKLSSSNNNLIELLRDGVRIAKDLIDTGKSYDNFMRLIQKFS